MRVTIEDLQAVFAQLLAERPEVSEGNVLYFRHRLQTYHCAVYVGLYDKPPSLNKSERQSIELSVHFIDADGKDLTFSRHTFQDIAVLCNRLQAKLNWGCIFATELADKSVIITLSRCFNTSNEDLERTAQLDFDSELGTAIEQLLTFEFQKLAPIITLFSAGRGNLELAEFMLAQSTIAPLETSNRAKMH